MTSESGDKQQTTTLSGVTKCKSGKSYVITGYMPSPEGADQPKRLEAGALISEVAPVFLADLYQRLEQPLR